MLADLSERFQLDQVFVAGFSNGASFAAAYACANARRVDGLATVAAVDYPEFRPEREEPVPEITFHSRSDSLIRFAGGTRHGHEYRSFEDVVARSAVRNGCEPVPTKTGLSDAFEHFVYEGCRAPLTSPRCGSSTFSPRRR